MTYVVFDFDMCLQYQIYTVNTLVIALETIGIVLNCLRDVRRMLSTSVSLTFAIFCCRLVC